MYRYISRIIVYMIHKLIVCFYKQTSINILYKNIYGILNKVWFCKVTSINSVYNSGNIID